MRAGDHLLANIAKANLQRWEPSGMSGLDGVPSQEVNVAVEKTYTEKIRLRSWWKGSEKRDRRCRTRSSSDPSRAKFELDLVDSLGTGGEGAGEQQLQGQHHLQQHCLQQQQSEDCCACCDDEAHAVTTVTAAAVTAAAVTTAAATTVFATAAATAVVSTAALPSMLQHPRIARYLPESVCGLVSRGRSRIREGDRKNKRD